jgi:hypothetical protein
VTLAVRDCLGCPYMSKRLPAAGFIPRLSGLATSRAPEPATLATWNLQEEREFDVRCARVEIFTRGRLKGGRMSFIRKYGFGLALAVAVIYAYAPPIRDDIAKLRWLDDINVIISKVLAPANREARVASVDPVAAANVDEDLDYRVAQRVKSIEGWRSFLVAHPDGPHAQSARAELDQLVGAQTPLAPEIVQPSNNGSPEMKTPSGATSASQPSPGSEVAMPTTDEVCRRDEDRLERLSNSRSSDEAMRFATELRCEKLRPQLFHLTERLDYQDPTPAVAAQSHSSKVAEVGVAGRRATEPLNRTHSRVASRSLQSRRQANRWAAPKLPPILMALFGETPRRGR